MKHKKLPNYPMVSICTPTYNRRPFYPMIIKCVENQKYPKDKIEWIIVDDGNDSIEDLVSHLPMVKYFRLEEKLSLGKKRNFANRQASGDIIVYMDDDDFYPPERISHAVDMLKSYPKALCAGSSEMYIYFKDMDKMYKFGPYGPNHATAATFAFRKELLEITSYDETAELAEEKHFLKNYTIPFVQLNPLKTILVFSHEQNSLDKRQLVDESSPVCHRSYKVVDDFVEDKDIKKFFLEDIDTLLSNYDPGKPQNKVNIMKKIDEMKETRMKSMIENEVKMSEYNNAINSILMNNMMRENEEKQKIDELTKTNDALKEKINFLNNKISTLTNGITSVAEEKSNRKNNKKKEVFTNNKELITKLTKDNESLLLSISELDEKIKNIIREKIESKKKQL